MITHAFVNPATLRVVIRGGAFRQTDHFNRTKRISVSHRQLNCSDTKCRSDHNIIEHRNMQGRSKVWVTHRTL